jgi:hypothetical protein
LLTKHLSWDETRLTKPWFCEYVWPVNMTNLGLNDRILWKVRSLRGFRWMNDLKRLSIRPISEEEFEVYCKDLCCWLSERRLSNLKPLWSANVLILRKFTMKEILFEIKQSKIEERTFK